MERSSERKDWVKGYEGWSFSDRSFAVALGLSIIWHLFWFSLVTIGLNPEKKLAKPRAKIIFLGPVLDDKIFHTLVESKPELSKTLSHRLLEFSAPVDIKTKTIERYNPGPAVNLPLEEKTRNSVRGMVGGAKASPEHEFNSPENK